MKVKNIDILIERMSNITDKAQQSNECKLNELKEAAQPLIDFLYKYYNPMYKIIVDIGYIEVVENDMGVPIKIRD